MEHFGVELLLCEWDTLFNDKLESISENINKDQWKIFGINHWTSKMRCTSIYVIHFFFFVFQKSKNWEIMWMQSSVVSRYRKFLKLKGNLPWNLKSINMYTYIYVYMCIFYWSYKLGVIWVCATHSLLSEFCHLFQFSQNLTHDLLKIICRLIKNINK